VTTKAASLQQLFIEDRVGTVDAAVLAYIMAIKPVTRAAICETTGLRVSTACGAIDRLMKKGLIEEAPDRVHLAETNRNVKAYQPKEQTHEQAAFPAHQRRD
jgi:DNA-binding MarR family transcriptional regulator